jgi:hypothetical protein
MLLPHITKKEQPLALLLVEIDIALIISSKPCPSRAKRLIIS